MRGLAGCRVGWSCQACSHPLGNPLTLSLGEGGSKSDKGFPEHPSSASLEL